ncbi:autotransporter-associated betastr and repeat-containing protein [Haloferula helveola]|uniref:Autotransporter-associated betastr and repeat-containing protein n=1 Tax=Haloferula helveola TaxID=490095 RepID=A0ABN6H2Z0_9BACT|nr:autotransporter-associated betastr and repeat-containing protein [Haloferula helveola]
MKRPYAFQRQTLQGTGFPAHLQPSTFTSALAFAAMLAWSSSADAGQDIYNTAGTTNWVCPPGVTSIQVECWGGGGAGGSGRKDNQTSTNSVQNGGGGGGGAYARTIAVPVTPGLSYTITIPPAAVSGSNGTTTNNSGAVNGGTVTFVGDSSVTVTAAGGTGGRNVYVNGTNTAASAGGGAGGTTAASVGDVKFAGGAGAAGTTGGGNVSGGGGGGAGDSSNGGAGQGGNNTPAAGGAGGIVGGGNGGNGVTGATTAGSQGPGGPGQTPGGGGGGGHNLGQNTQFGGTGGLGQIVITYTTETIKADNTDNLDLGSSWVGGNAPGTDAIAVCNNVVTSANTTLLGSDTTWAGLAIEDPAGSVSIDAGNTLTLGLAVTDIDMSAATQDLTLDCDLNMDGAHIWNVAAGRTLALGGTISGSSSVTKAGDGTAIISGTNQSTGGTTVTAGSLTYDVSSSYNPGGTGGAAGLLNVNGGSAVATLAGSYTATGNGNAYWEIRNGGVLNFSGTANVAGAGGLRIGEGSAGTMNMTGGSLDAAMNSGSNLVVGRSAGANGTLNMTGGVLSITNGGGISIANVAGNSGVMTVGGTGLVELLSTGNFAMGPGTATFNLNSGGTFVLGANSSASGTSTFNFDGGTLKAGRSSTAFLSAGITAVNVLAGGATIDSDEFSITLPGALLEDGVSTGGGLTKLGDGVLTLGGANTYTGTTNVNAGTLELSSAGTSVSDVVVASGAGAGAQVEVANGQHASTGDLALGNGSALVIDYGTTAPSTTVAPLLVDNLSLGTGLTLDLSGDLVNTLAVSQTYPIVSWTTSGPADGSGFTTVFPFRLAGTFSVAANTLYFTVTANAIGAISWNTGNGVWDTATTNWLDAASSPTTFADTLDDVLFGDAAGASGNPIVTLNTTVSPVSVKMNSSSHDYTISGTGAISGDTDLNLDAANTRTLTLANDNTYSGATAISGGTLSLGDGGTGGSLNTASTISLATGGVFAVNQSDTVTQGTEFSGAPITGAGGFAQTGSGTTVLNAANTYSGTTTVSGGTLQATVDSGVNGVGTSTLSIGPGSTLLLNDTFTTSGGTLTLNNTVTGTGLLQVQFAADTNPRNIQMPNVAGFNGTIQLSSLGTTGDKWNATGVGATGAALVIDPGNTLYVPNGVNPSFAGGISLSGSGNSEGRGAIRLSNGTLGGNISLAGDATINLDSSAANVSGDISSGAAGTQTLTLGATASTGGTLSGIIGGGTGTLNLATAVGGTHTLSNANTFTGTTTIGAGVLQLSDIGALSTTTGVAMADGTRLQSTLDGAVVNAPISIGGGGTNVTINAPTNAPGGGVPSTLELNGVISGDGNLTLSSSVNQNALSTVLLNAQSTYTGSTLITRIGSNTATQTIVRLGIDNALPVTTTVTLDGGDGAGTGRFTEINLNGFDQELAGLANEIRATSRRQRIVNSNALDHATLTINSSSDSFFSGYLGGGGGSVSGTATPGSTGGDNFSLVKNGTAKFALDVTSGAGGLSYDGDTTVNAGVLSLGRINSNNDTSTVSVASGARLELTFGGTDTVASLVLGGATQNNGVYGHTNSGADNGGQGVGFFDSFFEPGSGTITVQGGYSAWAAINAPVTGNDPDADEDLDGVPNGVEYVLGGTIGTNDLDKLPTASTSGADFLFSFVRDQASIDGTTAVVIEVGTTLASWPDVYAVPGGATANNPGVTVVKDSPSAGFDTITLTLPRAPDPAKFGRLKVTP